MINDTRRLQANAVPTKFDFPPRLQKTDKKRKPPLQRTVPVTVASSSMSAPDCGPSSDEHPSVTVIHDHPYDVKKSPSKLKRELDDALQVVSKFKKKLKVSQRKTSRPKKKVDSLISVVESVKENHVVSSACADVLETTFAGASRDLMKRIVSQKANKKPGAYTAKLRSFAMTLKLYSAKAYKYVRNTFDLGLPHPSTITTWYGAVNADPGFTKAAFSALSAKVLAAKRDGQDIICSLMLDEMAIRKHVDWDGQKFRGYVDIGTGVVDDSLPEAKDALVFMVVCVNGSWKVPCGYFLIDGLSSAEKANLVTGCLEKLYDVGVKVVSFTCDGPASHFAMLRILGANLDVGSLDPSFQHPCDHSA